MWKHFCMFLVSPSTKNSVTRYKSLFQAQKFRFILPSRLIAIILIPVLLRIICFNNGFSDPFFGYGNFKNCMIAVHLYVIEDMVGSIADSVQSASCLSGYTISSAPFRRRNFTCTSRAARETIFLASNSFNRDVVSSELWKSTLVATGSINSMLPKIITDRSLI